VRRLLRDMQRKLGEDGSIVMEGRDITTNVFPDADFKVYLDASIEERAKRRTKQLRQQGKPADYDEILEAIIQRDRGDLQRKINPLSGCLPIIVQMPILFSIWRAIIGSPELFSNAYFLWVRPGPIQLSYPQYFASSLADRDALLILLYGVTMVIQQQLTPSGGQGNQKHIGLVMSIFFTGLMWWYSWPCALIIYWVVFNFLNIIQQGLIHGTASNPATPVAPVTPAPS